MLTFPLNAVCRPVALAILFSLISGASIAQPLQIRYDASSGLLPNESCPAWTLTQTGGSASVGSGVLTLSSGVQAHELHYNVPVALANPVVVEFRARRISGTTSSPAREALGVAVNMGSNVGVHFFVGADVVFLTSGTNQRGPQASVDTDLMHTYRVEVSGSGVSVFYDNAQILTGSTFTSVDDFHPTAGIPWGDITNFADGVSEWQYVEHNSSAVECPVAVEASTWGRVKALYRQ